MSSAGADAAHVVVVGSFNVDHVWHCASLPVPGATLHGRYRSGPGGKGFNQAVACARSGAPTRFICALGRDAGADMARTLADGDAIQMDAQRLQEPTGSAGIFVDAQGRNCIVVSAGANAGLDQDFLALHLSLLRSGDVLLAQLESPPEAILFALRSGRQQGALTLLNPAPADAQVTAELLAETDVLTPNETECAALFATHLGQNADALQLALHDPDTLHAHCRALLAQGTVLITLGAHGVFVSHPSHRLRGDALPCYRVDGVPVDAIDTTGAGDAFNGALAAILALHPRQSFREAVRWANHYAALSTERHGAALAMPSQQQVLTRFGG